MDINDEDLLTILEHYNSNIDGITTTQLQKYCFDKVEASAGSIGNFQSNNNGYIQGTGQIETFKITEKGILKMRRFQQDKENKREERQSLLDTQESVRDTNKISGDNIKYQLKLFWLTFGVALLGSIAQWISIHKGNEVIELKLQLKKQDSLLQQELKEHKYIMLHIDSLLIQEDSVLESDSSKVK